jgi:hypothetical protein
MEDESKRAEAFLKETLAHIDALDEGIGARAHGYPTDLSAPSIRSLAVLQANIERLEQRQRDDNARSRKRSEVGPSILSLLGNIDRSSQYCPNPFIHWYRKFVSGRNASRVFEGLLLRARTPLKTEVAAETLGIAVATDEVGNFATKLSTRRAHWV